jgi:hypothetical protein
MGISWGHFEKYGRSLNEELFQVEWEGEQKRIADEGNIKICSYHMLSSPFRLP